MRIFVLLFILNILTPSAMAAEMFAVGKDQCASVDKKNFMAGTYIVIGQKDAGHDVPAPEDLYAAMARIKVDGCKAMVYRCENATISAGTLESGMFMSDIPMWKAKIGDREWLLEMEGDKDNYAVLHGSGEFWQADSEAVWNCNKPGKP